jgi:hypothetical protein
VSEGLTLRAWVWCLWHTRPWHKPAGIIADRRHAYCAACGAEAPIREPR